MNHLLVNAFQNEMLKIADTKAGRRRKRRRKFQALAAGGAGFGTGHVTAKYLYPAIMKALGKRAKVPSRRAAAIAGVLSGLSTTAMYSLGSEWAHVNPKRLNRSADRADRAGKSPDGSVAERHKGHSSKIPSGVLLHDAGGGESVSLRAGGPRRGVDHGGDRLRDHNFRRRDDKYRYRGKKTGDYSF